jgi:hypothetical protein
MLYSQFTLSRITKDYGLTLIEGESFIPDLEPLAPSTSFKETLEQNLPWAIAVGTEKARSETIITPILLELRRLLDNKISVFSGTNFDVEPEKGLTGYCDYLISQSPEQLVIEAPVIAIVEAKKDNLNEGLGQCVATMIAAQRFNEISNNTTPTVYGAVSTGTVWRFLKIANYTVTIELVDYPLQPVEKLLAILRWMAI